MELEKMSRVRGGTTDIVGEEIVRTSLSLK